MANASLSLPTTGFVAGRLATEADVKAGDAVFYIMGEGISPAPITIPQFVILREDPDAEGKLCVLVQAEQTIDGIMVGLRDADGANIVATLSELELLGEKVKP